MALMYMSVGWGARATWVPIVYMLCVGRVGAFWRGIRVRITCCLGFALKLYGPIAFESLHYFEINISDRSL